MLIFYGYKILYNRVSQLLKTGNSLILVQNRILVVLLVKLIIQLGLLGWMKLTLRCCVSLIIC